jgi:hypothetical protein
MRNAYEAPDEAIGQSARDIRRGRLRPSELIVVFHRGCKKRVSHFLAKLQRIERVFPIVAVKILI